MQFELACSSEWRPSRAAYSSRIKVPFYLDSMTTVFVAKSDTAIKKSVWLIRRAAVLEDGVSDGEIEPLHIPESDMAADPFTKYLPRDVWLRHMRFVTNTQVESK